MKYNISDLLDQLDVQDVELSSLSPLSSQCIKEITMRKVNGTYKRKPRILRKVLIAAAIIASLAVTAFAAEKIVGAGDWFREEKNLSEGQMELVNELGESFKPQTYRDQGTAIEAKAAYADEYVMYLYLSVTAPEGTVLPDGILYDFVDRNATDYSDPNGFRPHKLGGNAPYEAAYNYMKVEPMTDSDATDNHKDFAVILTATPDSLTRFNDGFTKYLSICGIYEQVVNVDGDEDGYKLLAPANVQIDITLNNTMDRLELDVDGIRYGGERTRTWTHEGPCFAGHCENYLTGENDPETGLPIHAETYEYYVTARSLSLTNMSVSWENEYQAVASDTSYALSFTIFMKDGSTVDMHYIGGGLKTSNDRTVGTCQFNAPIDLKDIDYVLVGDPVLEQTFKVYPPQE